MDDEERPGGIEPHLQRQTTASPESQVEPRKILREGERERGREGERELQDSNKTTKCGGGGRRRQIVRTSDHAPSLNFFVEELYSTCASPVVPHPSTGHAHGCLASEIGRDPAFPTRYDRTVDSPEVSLLTPSRQRFGAGKGLVRELFQKRERENSRERIISREKWRERE